MNKQSRHKGTAGDIEKRKTSAGNPWKTESGQAPDPTVEKKKDRRGETSKLRAETENITSISEDLNEFSEEIEANPPNIQCNNC